MKSILTKFLVMMTLVTSINANAIVGLMADDSDVVLFGAALMDISQITVVDRRDVIYRHRTHYDRRGRRHTHTNRVVVYTWRTITYVPLALTGLFFLNDAGSVQFSPLTTADAQKLGITSNELNTYNNELDQINAIAEEVKSEVALAQTQEEKVDTAAAEWTELSEYISPESAKVLKLVSQKLTEQE